jgi:hypothetical protein
MSVPLSLDRRAAYVRSGIPAQVSRHYRAVAVELRAAAYARAWEAIIRAVRGAFRAAAADQGLWAQTAFRRWN